MKKERRHHSAEQKVTILRRHLLEKAPVSDLCEEFGLQPTVFYRWQKEFFENGAAAFQQRGRTNHQPEQERIAYLEKKIRTKDEVLAELMAEHVALKKREFGLYSGRKNWNEPPFLPVVIVSERSSPSSVRCAAPAKRRALDCCGPLRARSTMEERGKTPQILRDAS